MQWDISAPPFGDRVVLDNFQKHSYPIGIVVNMNGERFVDEGADFRNHTYAKYGREVMKQPQRTAVQIFDSQDHRHGPRRIPHPRGDQGRSRTRIEELAEKLEIDVEGLVRTVREFNAACQPGDYNPSILDGKRTKGITPPKSNWALPIDEPPYQRLRRHLRHHLHLRRSEDQHRRRGAGHRPTARSPACIAAGELVGGLFYQNYPGGTGLMSGSVFGRIAGTSAGRYGTG